MMKKPNLSAQLHELSARIDARPRRERVLLCVATAAVAFLLIDAVAFGPALKAWQKGSRQRDAAQASIARLQVDAGKRVADGNLQLRQQQAELATWRQRVRDGEAQLRSYETTLIGPDQMLPLLDKVLARHGGLKLRSMQPLGRTDLLAANTEAAAPVATTTISHAVGAARAGAGSAKSKAKGAPPPAAAQAANANQATTLAANAATPPVAAEGPAVSLYRHGVQLTVEGSFADLMAYVQALEAMPQRVLWGSVGFKVEQYPKAALTLQLYTISRDRVWLEI
jgi:MSHA biogenesis protein MshJ